MDGRRGAYAVLVKYRCRYCRMPLGVLADEARLGFAALTPEERADIITYDSDGEITVRLVCDYCRQALEAHPELWLAPNPLQ